MMQLLASSLAVQIPIGMTEPMCGLCVSGRIRSWAEWIEYADRTFEVLENTSRKYHGVAAIGFKLMYSQVRTCRQT